LVDEAAVSIVPRRSGVVALAAATLLGACSGEVPPGPLTGTDGHAWAIEAKMGKPFTDGFNVLELSGDQDAVITSVELVDAEGMEIVGAEIAGPDRGYGAVQHFKGFPPNDYAPLDPGAIVSAEGATLSPGGSVGGYELLIGIRPVKSGFLERKGVRVNYTVDGEEFSRVLPSKLYVCSGDGKVDLEKRCKPPADWDADLPGDF
jgi:hypothetical protein